MQEKCHVLLILLAWLSRLKIAGTLSMKCGLAWVRQCGFYFNAGDDHAVIYIPFFGGKKIAPGVAWRALMGRDRHFIYYHF